MKFLKILDVHNLKSVLWALYSIYNCLIYFLHWTEQWILSVWNITMKQIFTYCHEIIFCPMSNTVCFILSWECETGFISSRNIHTFVCSSSFHLPRNRSLWQGSIVTFFSFSVIILMISSLLKLLVWILSLPATYGCLFASPLINDTHVKLCAQWEPEFLHQNCLFLRKTHYLCIWKPVLHKERARHKSMGSLFKWPQRLRLAGLKSWASFRSPTWVQGPKHLCRFMVL